MEVKTHTEQGTLVAEVSGKMDATTAPAYLERLRQELAGGELRLVVDCSGLEYLSSAGLRTILTIYKELARNDGKQAFCNLNEQVKEVFRISGFASVIPIHDTRDAAIASLLPQAAGR